MSFFNWARWLRSLYRPRHSTIRKRKPYTPSRMELEILEERTLLSTLPQALVSDQTTIRIGTTNLQGTTPSVAINPIDPQELVEVHVNAAGTLMVGSFSRDGGATWS